MFLSSNREAYLQRYPYETNTHYQQREMSMANEISPDEDTKVKKSVKEQKKTSSKTCIVM